MKLSDKTIEKINSEFKEWEEVQYAGKSVKERQALGAFFTPPVLSIKMLEKYDDLDGNFLDPTVGCGGLLAAAVIAGADPRKCYGIELDPEIAKLCRERLAKLGVPRTNIKIGDALSDESYEFDDSLEDKKLFYFKVEDLGMCRVKVCIEMNASGKVSSKELVIDYAKDESKVKAIFEKIWTLFEAANEKGYYFYSEKLEGRLKFLNAFFNKYFKKKFKCDRLVEII